MPELKEGIAALVDFMEKDEKCNYKPDKTNWKANLEGSAAVLGGRLGKKPNANTESELSSDNWPSQAHHLIPHLTLIAHAVAKWLKADQFIYEDTKYDVDHKKNGKWMPYASSLPEWAIATPQQKRDLMFKVMRLAKIQMHQGPHSSKNTYGIALYPYKERVRNYLDKVKDHSVSHYAGKPPCEDCKGKKQHGKYPPRENTVAHVDKVSELLEKDINKRIIFVSRIAAEFAQIGGFDS